MPGEGAAYQLLKPCPVSLGPHNRVQAHKPATALNISAESKTLFIGVKNIIIGVGKYQQCILLQVLLSKH